MFRNVLIRMPQNATRMGWLHRDEFLEHLPSFSAPKSEPDLETFPQWHLQDSNVCCPAKIPFVCPSVGRYSWHYEQCSAQGALRPMRLIAKLSATILIMRCFRNYQLHVEISISFRSPIHGNLCGIIFITIYLLLIACMAWASGSVTIAGTCIGECLLPKQCRHYKKTTVTAYLITLVSRSDFDHYINTFEKAYTYLQHNV